MRHAYFVCDPTEKLHRNNDKQNDVLILHPSFKPMFKIRRIHSVKKSGMATCEKRKSRRVLNMFIL